MTEIRLDFLDRARIRRSGEEVSPRGLPTRLVGLLALLAAEATRSVPVERVLLLLWPEVGEALARKSLNQVLVRARRLLPGALERPTEHQLQLSPGVASDVHDLLFGAPFRSCSDVPPHAQFELLPGFSIRDCPELNDWLDRTRARVRARAADAALERMEGLAPAEALCWAALAYRLNRADERAAAALVRGTAAVSGPAAAWAAFTEHRRWLAEELDITPSARLTGIAADACRAAGLAGDLPAPPVLPPAVGGPAVKEAPSVPAPAAPEAFRPAWRRSLGNRRRELVAGVATLAVLSAATWLTMPTRSAEATRSPGVVLLRAALGAGAVGDSAVRLASSHLARHGVSAEVLRDQGAVAGLRLVVPGWREDQVVRLSLAARAHATTDELAAALTDSVLALVGRSGQPEHPGPYRGRGAAGELLRATQAALANARGMIAVGGPSAALVMLARADSLAMKAARAASRDWQPHALRAEIANLAFWHGLAVGAVDSSALRGGEEAADSAVRLGGGNAALKARATLRFSRWVLGGPGSAAAGEAAQRDYAEVVKSAPADGEAWSKLAKFYHARGRLGDAYSAAHMALPHVSGEALLDTYMELFLAALDRRDYSRAGHWCSELGFHFSRSWFAATCAAMYAWADPNDSARSAPMPLVEEASGLLPSLEAQLALLRAGAELARGNDSAASHNIRLARPFVDRDPEVASIWAGVLVELGMADSALSTLRRYLKDAPPRRLIVSRPWFRPLYRPNESWGDFVERLGTEIPGADAGDERSEDSVDAASVGPGTRPRVRDADTN